MVSSYTLLVDDTDQRITYSPAENWTRAGSSLEHNSTTHFPSRSPASFSFPFNGTSITIFGTEGSGPAPSINCTVDGTTIHEPIVNLIAPTTYNFPYCSFTSLSPNKEHLLEFTVNATLHQLFFDYLLYTSPTESPMDIAPAGSLVDIIIDDSRTDLISYNGPSGTGSWDSNDPTGFEFEKTVHGSSAAGATATFEFQGTGVQVYGAIGPAATGSSIDVSYIIDNDQALKQSLAPTSDGSIQEQIRLFESPLLQDGNHTLTISSSPQGGSNMEFFLDFFVFTASPSFGIAISPVSGSPSESEVSTPSAPSQAGSNSNTKNANHTGVIVGVSITAALVLLSLLAFFAFYHVRRRRARTIILSEPSPISNRVQPFMIDTNRDNVSRTYGAQYISPSTTSPTSRYEDSTQTQRGQSFRSGEGTSTHGEGVGGGENTWYRESASTSRGHTTTASLDGSAMPPVVPEKRLTGEVGEDSPPPAYEYQD